jgi:hypothetical protein
VAESILPQIGLVWFANFDPTTAGGVAAPIAQFLIRTDDQSLWYKVGNANTAWQLITGGGAGLTAIAHDTSLAGDGTLLTPLALALVTHDGSLAGTGAIGDPLSVVGIPGSAIEIDDEGVPLGAFGTLDFVGAGVTATDAGGGIARITIPGGDPTKQVFRYIATGAEGDTFAVARPAARATVNYDVQATMGKNATGIAIEGLDPAGFLVNQFTIKLTAAPALNDSIMFTVEDLT